MCNFTDRTAGMNEKTHSAKNGSISLVYRVIHRLPELGLVDCDLGVPPSYPAAQPLLPYSHGPRQNWANSATLRIKVNPVHEQMQHPVFSLDLLAFTKFRFQRDTS